MMMNQHRVLICIFVYLSGVNIVLSHSNNYNDNNNNNNNENNKYKSYEISLVRKKGRIIQPQIINNKYKPNNLDSYDNFALERYRFQQLLSDSVKATDIVEELAGGIVEVSYSIKLNINGQTVLLTADTGSSMTVVVDSSCIQVSPSGTSSCASKNHFDSSSSNRIACNSAHNCSSTAKYSDCSKNYCYFSVMYGDGSNGQGLILNNQIKFENTNYASSYFVGIDLENSVADGHAVASESNDGILGLAYTALSDGYPTIFDTIRENEKLPNQFGICLNQIGGKLILGSPNKKYYKNELQYTEIVDESHYRIQLNSLSIGNTIINIPSTYRPIVDSGTTLTTLPMSTFIVFKNAICSTSPSWLCDILTILVAQPNAVTTQCFDDDDFDSIPSLVFNFPHVNTSKGSFPIEIPSRLWLHYYKGSGFNDWCGTTGIMPMVSTGNYIILGDTFMRYLYVDHDRDNKQIGFAPANLSECGEFIKRNNWTNIFILLGSLAAAFIVVTLLFRWYQRRNDRANSSSLRDWRLSQGHSIASNNNVSSSSLSQVYSQDIPLTTMESSMVQPHIPQPDTIDSNDTYNDDDNDLVIISNDRIQPNSSTLNDDDNDADNQPLLN